MKKKAPRCIRPTHFGCCTSCMALCASTDHCCGSFLQPQRLIDLDALGGRNTHAHARNFDVARGRFRLQPLAERADSSEAVGFPRQVFFVLHLRQGFRQARQRTTSLLRPGRSVRGERANFAMLFLGCIEDKYCLINRKY